jgi:hypothetical protein
MEAGYDRFMIENNFRITRVDYRLIRDFSRSTHIEIMNTIKIMGSSCFAGCSSLSLISFESNSRLTRIDSSAFLSSSLQSIKIPRNVEMIGSSCFSCCKSLSSISFESGSQLKRIEAAAVDWPNHRLIFSLTALFIISSALDDRFQISFAEADSGPESGQRQRLGTSGLVVNFRRIALWVRVWKLCQDLSLIFHDSI